MFTDRRTATLFAFELPSVVFTDGGAAAFSTAVFSAAVLTHRRSTTRCTLELSLAMGANRGAVALLATVLSAKMNTLWGFPDLLSRSLGRFFRSPGNICIYPELLR
jgi:hypothetical protein